MHIVRSSTLLGVSRLPSSSPSLLNRHVTTVQAPHLTLPYHLARLSSCSVLIFDPCPSSPANRPTSPLSSFLAFSSAMVLSFLVILRHQYSTKLLVGVLSTFFVSCLVGSSPRAMRARHSCWKASRCGSVLNWGADISGTFKLRSSI